MRTPSVYGDFEQPHLRHEMAILASHDTVWYAAARANPENHLPRFYEFIKKEHRRNFSSQMTTQLRDLLQARAAAFLQEAEASHFTWNATTWTRARHLLGVLCAEDRRQWMAAELLKVIGAEQQLRAKLPTGSWPQPRDAVDRVLLRRLQTCSADGSLETEMGVWGLRREAVIRELLMLAVAPSGDTELSPVLTEDCTPLLFEQMRNRLFVGFAHNLALESMVSRLAMLEKRHPRTHALTLDATFNYHMHDNQVQGRLDRHSASMRSSVGGGLRRNAKDRAEDGKAITGGANRSKVQQEALSKNALTRAGEYSGELLFKKGPNGVAQLARKAKREYNAGKMHLSAVKACAHPYPLTLSLTPSPSHPLPRTLTLVTSPSHPHPRPLALSTPPLAPPRIRRWRICVPPRTSVRYGGGRLR